jgi:Tol biopolymer transport system component
MLVTSLTGTTFTNVITVETNAQGRASALVQFGTVAGPAHIAVTVPTTGAQDTARYTVQPGQPTAVKLAPSDTAMYVGRTYALRGGVVDRFANVRPDPVTYTVSTGGVTVSGAGVVSASATGRYTVTATAGSASTTSLVSVVPQGRLTAVRSVGSGLRIVSLELDGSDYRDLTSVVSGGGGPRPRWIAGTNTIVYSHYDGSRQVLRTVDQDGRVAPFLGSPPPTMTDQAEASPAATAPVVYFSAYDSQCPSGGNNCLYRTGVDGSNVEMLSLTLFYSGVTLQPAASPNGSKVAFAMSGQVIRVFDYASKTVSSWSAQGSFPSWSPDGARIAWVEPSFGGHWVMNADGTNARRIEPAPATYRQSSISWSRDSKWIIASNFDGTLHVVEVDTGTEIPLPFTFGYGPAGLK